MPHIRYKLAFELQNQCILESEDSFGDSNKENEKVFSCDSDLGDCIVSSHVNEKDASISVLGPHNDTGNQPCLSPQKSHPSLTSVSPLVSMPSKELWLSSDSELEQPLSFFKRRHKSQLPLKKDVISDVEIVEFKSSSINEGDSISPRKWESLDVCLRSLLPNEEGITYVVSSFSSLPKEEFSGAPAYAFESTIRVNVNSADDAKNGCKV